MEEYLLDGPSAVIDEEGNLQCQKDIELTPEECKMIANFFVDQPAEAVISGVKYRLVGSNSEKGTARGRALGGKGFMLQKSIKTFVMGLCKTDAESDALKEALRERGTTLRAKNL
eukprot:TRINITY_DN1916_c0_g1_i1.p2 TRINITY_DN1916_c0_g1~~TRINITY_DN1916_c0_g1_i1.p2  ORF type:complete len:115 (+),score=14.19 TRINITY_DN1916_c0_g1_i1:24-368(+)